MPRYEGDRRASEGAAPERVSLAAIVLGLHSRLMRDNATVPIFEVSDLRCHV